MMTSGGGQPKHGVRGSGSPEGSRGEWDAYHWSSAAEVQSVLTGLEAIAQNGSPKERAAVVEFSAVMSSPIRVAVKGREGVGKSQVVKALSSLLRGELQFSISNFDRSLAQDMDREHDSPEIVLHVLTAAARATDKDASRSVDTTMACGLLNKCDTLSTPGDEQLWKQASEAAARLSRELGYPIFPAVALLANVTIDDQMLQWLTMIAHAEESMPPSAEFFIAAGKNSSVGTAQREHLVKEMGIYGLYCSLRSVQDPAHRDASRLTGLMREYSGLGAFLPCLRNLTIRARARRMSELIAKMEHSAALGVLRDPLEEFLGGAVAARLRMDAAVSSGVLDPSEIAYAVSEVRDPGTALRAASRFRALSTRSSDPRAATLAWDLHAGFLRIWAQNVAPREVL